jgi:hypothetical protein
MRWRTGLAAIVLVVSTIIALNWQWFSFAAAVAFAERRPALLADAQWDEPARRFSVRFRPGASEAELLGWLESNEFAIDRGTGHASRLIRGLPCNEAVDVRWSKNSGDMLTSAEARVSEAGCL